MKEIYRLLEKARNQNEEFQALCIKQQSLAARMMETIQELSAFTKSKDEKAS